DSKIAVIPEGPNTGDFSMSTTVPGRSNVGAMRVYSSPSFAAWFQYKESARSAPTKSVGTGQRPSKYATLDPRAEAERDRDRARVEAQRGVLDRHKRLEQQRREHALTRLVEQHDAVNVRPVVARGGAAVD